MQSFTVSRDFRGLRLDRFLVKHSFNFSLIQKLIRKKSIKVNSKAVSADYRLDLNDKIEVFANVFTEKKVDKASKPNPQKIKDLENSIIFKDDNLLAFNKMNGLAVQGGSGINFSIDSALPYLCFGKEEKPRLVHRLDKDTSGVLLIARNRICAELLNNKFKNRTIKKTYLALVIGAPSKKSGTIDIPIVKKYKAESEKVYKDNILGKKAITHYKVLQEYPEKNYSLLELKPITGRTHQLRVHLKEIGHPIIGDGKYGGKSAFIKGMKNRLHLHALKISIDDFFGKELTIKTDNPF